MPQAQSISSILFLIGFIVFAVLLFVYILTSPEEASKLRKSPFINRYYAHRGLYTKDQSIPENSMAAFKRAVEAGYGIELDIQLTRDNKVVVAHDDDTFRVCGEGGIIRDMTFEELSELRLFGTDEKIPFFWDVLEMIDGKVPLIIEFKPGGDKYELCKYAFEMLDAYEGDYCVESFDPAIVRWFRFFKPQLLRGQLSMPANHYDKTKVPALARFFMSRCLFGMINKPNFIAYEVGPKPWTVKFAEKRGALRVCWTSHDPEDAKKNDIVIFEHYEPPITY